MSLYGFDCSTFAKSSHSLLFWETRYDPEIQTLVPGIAARHFDQIDVKKPNLKRIRYSKTQKKYINFDLDRMMKGHGSQYFNLKQSKF